MTVFQATCNVCDFGIIVPPEDVDTGVTFEHGDHGPMIPVIAGCQWFTLCTELATTTRWHPVLGNVPICERCDTRAEHEGR